MSVTLRLLLRVLLFSFAAFAFAAAQECNQNPVRAVFLVDLTAETPSIFRQEQKRLIDTAIRLNNATQGRDVAIAVVAFTRNAVTLLGFDSKDSKDINSVVDHLGSLQHRPNIETSPAKAMEAAAEQLAFKVKRGTKTLVVMSHDGYSTDLIAETLDATTKLQKHKAVLFAVTSNPSPNILALIGYTNDRNRVFVSNNDKRKFHEELKDTVDACLDFSGEKKDQKAPGQRIFGVPSTNEVNKAKNVLAADECNATKVDLMVVLDTSGSVYNAFAEERQLVLDLISAIEPGAFVQTIQIGTVRFASEASIAIPMRTGKSKDEILEKIQGIEFTGSHTRIADAVDLGLAELLAKKRRDARQIFLLITDGHGQEYWNVVQATGKRLQSAGVDIYSVTTSRDYNFAELMMYTGDESHVFVGPQYTRFIPTIATLINKCLRGTFVSPFVKRGNFPFRTTTRKTTSTSSTTTTTAAPLPETTRRRFSSVFRSRTTPEEVIVTEERTRATRPIFTRRITERTTITTTTELPSTVASEPNQVQKLEQILKGASANTEEKSTLDLEKNDHGDEKREAPSAENLEKEDKNETLTVSTPELAKIDLNETVAEGENKEDDAPKLLEELENLEEPVNGTDPEPKLAEAIRADLNGTEAVSTPENGQESDVATTVAQETKLEEKVPEAAVNGTEETLKPETEAEIDSTVTLTTEANSEVSNSTEPTEQLETTADTVTATTPEGESFWERRDNGTEVEGNVVLSHNARSKQSAEIEDILLKTDHSNKVEPENFAPNAVCDTDLMFLIDRSQSVDGDFVKELNFAVELVGKILPEDLDSGRIRVAAISYAMSAIKELGFNNGLNKENLTDALKTIENVGGSTSVVTGIQEALDEIKFNRREKARLMVVYVSDGNSQDFWDTLVSTTDSLLKLPQTDVFAVTLSNNYNEKELEQYTGNKWKVYVDARVRQFISEISKVLISCVDLNTQRNLSGEKEPRTSIERVEELQKIGKVIEDPCLNDPIDLVIVLDISTSITKEFDAQKQVALDLIKQAKAKDFPKRIRVALVTFNHVATLKFGFAAHETQDEVLFTLDKIEHTGGQTSLVNGIDRAVQEIELLRRTEARLFVLIISDGNSRDAWAHVLRSAKSLQESTKEGKGQIFAITLSAEHNKNELKQFTGDEERVFVNSQIPSFLAMFDRMFSECGTEPVLTMMQETEDPQTIEKDRKRELPVIENVESETRAPLTVDITTTVLGDEEIAGNSTEFPVPEVKVLDELMKSITEEPELAQNGTGQVEGSLEAGSKHEELAKIISQEQKKELKIAPEAAGLENGGEKLEKSEEQKPEEPKAEEQTPQEPKVAEDKSETLNIKEIVSQEQKKELNITPVVSTEQNQPVQTDNLELRSPHTEEIVDDAGSKPVKSEGEDGKPVREDEEEGEEAAKSPKTDVERDINSQSDESLAKMDEDEQKNITTSAEERENAEDLTKEVLNADSDETKVASEALMKAIEENTNVTVTHEEETEPVTPIPEASESSAVPAEPLQAIKEEKREILEPESSSSRPPHLGSTPSFALASGEVAPKVSILSEGCKVDLVLIIDTSQSVEKEFEKQLQFAVDLVKRLPEDDFENRVNVAVVSFHRKATIEIPFGKLSKRSEVLDALFKIAHTGGSTSAVSGVELALQEIAKGRRPDARTMVVLVSDGNSQDPWDKVLEAADGLRTIKADVYAVTVSHDYYFRELELYAGNKWFVYIDARIRQFLDEAELSLVQCMNPEIPGSTTAPSTIPPLDSERTRATPAPHIEPTTFAPSKCKDKVDLFFILDTSTSVEKEFYAEKNFAIDLVKVLPDSEFVNRVSVALSRFSGSGHLQFEFGQERSKGDVLYELERVEHTGGQTSLVSGAQVALDEIKKKHRPGARLIIVIVSDGNSQDEWKNVQQTAKDLRETGGDVFAVTLSEKYYLDELKEYTGNETRVFIDEKIEQFIKEVGNDVQKCTDPVDSADELTAATDATTTTEATTTTPAKTANKIDEFAKDEFPLSVRVRDSKPLNHNKVKRPCSWSKMDLIIILDASTSRQGVFEHQRELALSLIERLPIAKDETHVAVGINSFTHVPTLRQTLGLGRDKEMVRRAIEDIKYNGGSTLTAEAVELAVSDLNRGRRPDALQVVVLMNDGMSQDPWDRVLQASAELASTHAERFGVALGDDVDLRELRHYIADDKRIYRDGETERFLSDVVTLLQGGDSECATPSADTEEAPKDDGDFDACKKPDLDLVVLFKNSDSTADLMDPAINSNRYLLLDVLGSLPSNGRVNIAVIPFSQSPKVQHNFNDAQDRDSLFTSVESIQAVAGEASYARAVEFGLDYYNKHKRPTARGMILILGDGNSKVDSREERSGASNLVRKAKGLQCYAVDSGKEIDTQTLASYTGSPNRVYNYDRNAEFAQQILQLATSGDAIKCANNKNKKLPPVSASVDEAYSTSAPLLRDISPQSDKDLKNLDEDKIVVKTTTKKVITPRPTTTTESTTTTSTTTTTRTTTTTQTTTTRPPTSIRSTTRRVTRPITTEPITEFRPGCLLDVMIILDTSGSVEETFLREKDLAAGIIDDLRVGPQNARVALIKFASAEKVRTVWSFDNPQSKTRVLRALHSIPFSSGTTAIHSAILQGITEYSSIRGARPGEATPIAIVFTDGFGQQDTSEAATLLRRIIPNTYAVAINHEFPISRQELENIAGAKERVFTDANIDDFHKILRQFTKNCL